MSLGGVRDEAEIRGHPPHVRRGPCPGRIMQGIKQAGTNNPVFMLDEVDKVGMDFRGDPFSRAVGSVGPRAKPRVHGPLFGRPLRPQQRDVHHDGQSHRPPFFRLSGTAWKSLKSPDIPKKKNWGLPRRYLIPRQLEKHGISEKHFRITDLAVQRIVTHYTREAGVRNLERELANAMRKVARRVAEGKPKLHSITPRSLRTYIGIPKYLPETEKGKRPGRVGRRIGLDGNGRGNAAHRSHGHAGQRQPDLNGSSWRRHEGIRPSRAQLCPGTSRHAGHQGRNFLDNRHSYSRACRRHPQGWAFSGDYHGDGSRVESGEYSHPGTTSP